MDQKRSIKERILSAAVAGDDLRRALLKATDSEARPPKPKHIETLLYATHLLDVAIEDVAEGLYNRLRETSWVVVLKCLVVFHRLFRDGHERFLQYVVTRSHVFELDAFMDEKAEGAMISLFIRHYAQYLNEKIFNYRQTGVDYTHVKFSKQAESFAKNVPPQLFKDMSGLQSLLGNLLEHANPITAGGDVESRVGRAHLAVHVTLNIETILRVEIVQVAYELICRDALKFFVTLNDGVVNILERFFTFNKRDAQEAFGIFQLFIVQCNEIDFLLRICQTNGVMDGKDFPRLHHAPASLQPKLAEYLKSLGGSILPSPAPRSALRQPAASRSQDSSPSRATHSPAPLGEVQSTGSGLLSSSIVVTEGGSSRLVSSNSPRLPRKDQGIPTVLPSEMWKKPPAPGSPQAARSQTAASTSVAQAAPFEANFDGPAPQPASGAAPFVAHFDEPAPFVATFEQPAPFVATFDQPAAAPFEAVFDQPAPAQPAPQAAQPYNPFLD
eukprot:m.416549 g.416549  ORF g.416549 m.416549 type:complete len:499 (-) comp56612_c0_seq3:155-1651(-)